MNFSEKKTGHRKSIRLQGFDYSKSGLYYLTIITHKRELLFGEISIENEFGIQKMYLNEAGLVARKCWLEIPDHFPKVVLHEFIIMPDHIHGIIEFKPDEIQYETFISKKNEYGNMIPRSIGSIVKGFKIGVTKWFRSFDKAKIVWHRNYYEHIIRNQQEYDSKSQYIRDNPVYWKGKVTHINMPVTDVDTHAAHDTAADVDIS